MARIADLIAAGRTFSFEFFPPKTDEAQLTLGRTIAELEPLRPAFVSVTYGAGGSTRARTRDVVTWVRRETDITPMAHLTCQGHRRDEIPRSSTAIARAGVENIMALGGDMPIDPAERASERLHVRRPSSSTRFARLGHFSDRRRRSSRGPSAIARPRHRSPSPRRQAAQRRLRRHPVLLRGRALRPPGRRARLRSASTSRCSPASCPSPTRRSIERMAELSGARCRRGCSTASTPPTTRWRRARSASTIATELCADLLASGAPGLHFYTLNRSTATREIYANIVGSRDGAVTGGRYSPRR